MKKECRMAAGGVVIREDPRGLRVLLIEDGYGHWTWPKGHVEPGETLSETALREISEETGQRELEVLEELGKQEYDFLLDGESVHKEVTLFLVRAVGADTLTPQVSEIVRAEWIFAEDAAAKIEYRGSKELLLKGIDTYSRSYRADGGY